MKWHVAGLAVGVVFLCGQAIAQRGVGPGRPGAWERPRARGHALTWNRTKTETSLEVAPTLAPSAAEFSFLSSVGTPATPGGAAFDGTNLWTSEFFGRLIHCMDPATGEVLLTIPAPGPYVGGLAWDGAALWCIPEQTATIFQIDPATGAVLHSIPAPSLGQRDPNGSGLAWDGTALWHADYGMRRVYRLDPADGTILAEHPVTATMAAGLGYHGGILVLADAMSQELLMIQASDGAVLSTHPSPGRKPWGVAGVPSGDFWITDFDELTASLMAGSSPPWFENYCEAMPNSMGAPASISAEGSASVESNDLMLMASNVPDGYGFFMFSRRQVHVPWAGRMICVGRPAFRTRILRANDGIMSHKLNLNGRRGMREGDTWNFQGVFRDRKMGRPGFNTTNGMTITFQR